MGLYVQNIHKYGETTQSLLAKDIPFNALNYKSGGVLCFCHYNYHVTLDNKSSNNMFQCYPERPYAHTIF